MYESKNKLINPEALKVQENYMGEKLKKSLEKKKLMKNPQKLEIFLTSL